MVRTCKNPAFARASAKGSPCVRPAASAASFKAAMRGPPAPATTRTNGRSGAIGSCAVFFVAFACAASTRRIGQRGSQTETMRDMIVLHHPFARPSVATAFKFQVPSGAGDEAGAVARGLGGADAPAGRRCAAPSPPSPALGGGGGGGDRAHL